MVGINVVMMVRERERVIYLYAYACISVYVIGEYHNEKSNIKVCTCTYMYAVLKYMKVCISGV